MHDNTLRRWADRGMVPSRRTAGGHRRFFVSELGEGSASIADSGPPAAVDAAWQPDRLTPSQRSELAKLGRRLAELLQACYLGETPAGGSADAGQIGRAYAHRARAIGLSLSEAMSAFVHYRAHMFQDLVTRPKGTALLAAFESVVGAVLIGLAQGYESCMTDTDRGPSGTFAAPDGPDQREAPSPAAPDFPDRPPRRDP